MDSPAEPLTPFEREVREVHRMQRTYDEALAAVQHRVAALEAQEAAMREVIDRWAGLTGQLGAQMRAIVELMEIPKVQAP